MERWAWVIIGILFFSPGGVVGHITWFSPPARIGENIKIGPCGNVSAGPPENAMVAGEYNPILLDEFVNHNGFFQISISFNGEGAFQEIDRIQDTLYKGKYFHNLMIPDSQLGPGILQVIQYMIKSNDTTFYFSCSDINVVSEPVSIFKKEKQTGPFPTDQGIRAFPNPFRAALNIKGLDPTGRYQWKVFNVAGMLVRQGRITGKGLSPSLIELPKKMSSGKYILTMQGQDFNQTIPLLRN